MSQTKILSGVIFSPQNNTDLLHTVVVKLESIFAKNLSAKEVLLWIQLMPSDPWVNFNHSLADKFVQHHANLKLLAHSLH